MDWRGVRAGLFDELDKIAQVDLRGLSNETLMSSQAPPEIASPGFAKAKSILDMAQQLEGEQVKTSAAKRKSTFPQQPNYPFNGKLTNPEDKSRSEQAKGVLGYTAAGAGTGGLAHRGYTNMEHVVRGVINPATKGETLLRSAKVGRRLMGGGAAVGLGYGAYRAIKRNQQAKVKTSDILSPGLALKATQQVGKIKNVVHTGSGIKSQTPLIGRKGA